MSTGSPRSTSPVRLASSDWIKATRSGDGGTCVELRRHAGSVEIRDSKDPSGPILRVPGDGLAAWLDAARAGKLDDLLG